MRKLNRKILRDLARMKGQTAAIALVIAAGVGVFLMYRSAFDSLSLTRASYYEQQRFGEVFASAKRVPGSVAAKLAAIPGIATLETRVVAEDASGDKALSNYLGPNRVHWRAHDAVALIEDGARVDELLVDVGGADPFLEKELKPELLEAACRNAGIPLTLRRQPGYDHSYYFISTFMAEHVRWHAERLRR